MSSIVRTASVEQNYSTQIDRLEHILCEKNLSSRISEFFKNNLETIQKFIKKVNEPLLINAFQKKFCEVDLDNPQFCVYDRIDELVLKNYEDCVRDVLITKDLKIYFIGSHINDLKVGRGRYKKVYYAMKINSCEQIKAVGVQTKSSRYEIELYKELCHLPNILPIEAMFSFDQFDESYNHEVTKQYFISDYHQKGNLKDLVNQLTYIEKIEIFEIIMSLVALLHQKGFLVRDLKLENFVLADNHVPYLVDLGGICRMTDEDKLSNVFCSPKFSAPEIALCFLDMLEKKKQNLKIDKVLIKRSNTQKIDVWALGLIFYRFFFGVPSYFQYNELKTLLTAIGCCVDGLVEDKTDSPIQDLIKGMLTVDPTKRFSMDVVETFYKENHLKEFLTKLFKDKNAQQ